MSRMYCKDCGVTLYRSILLALVQDMGCRVSVSSDYCHATEDHQHNWVEPEKPAPKEAAHE